ncbi:MAG TPA: L-serine ammonia-lyase [Rhabdochlamydiaceae bacterium]|nr:L-serine ammonia-lyase [Rhabdochlamydiaceae bacterium]
MAVSLFQVFSIGIGPSSSHTVGPMRAALAFISGIEKDERLLEVAHIQIELFGSLAMTGKGHGTDAAILLGLEGETPEEIDPNSFDTRFDEISNTNALHLLQKKKISFNPQTDLLFHKGQRLPYHSNAMRFKAFDESGKELFAQIYYSTGGGFIVDHEQIFAPPVRDADDLLPYPFKTCDELLAICNAEKKMIYEIMMKNEMAWRSVAEIRAGILKIWQAMQDCVKRGVQQEGILPGGLNVRRRAKPLYEQLLKQEASGKKDPSTMLDWISLYALAVNEENAAKGRVVTAPTNGAAGIIPAVLHYYMKFTENPTEDGIVNFFLTAAAIAILYKEGASLAAAEMGCQGEVGVACSMAAGALVAALGGTNEQIENAAEIGMEHHLGLTCDPVAGLVQIPCIERNTMGAIKAINAARLALHGDGQHVVSLDQVIRTMRQTGEDMKHIYKETSEGGLALHVNAAVVEC